MKLYRFHKVYIDLVTEDGIVLILYLSWFETLGFTIRLSALTIYEKNKQPLFYRGVHTYDLNDVLSASGELNFSMVFKGAKLSISYHESLDGKKIVNNYKNTFYQCLMLSGNGKAEITTDNTVLRYNGRGYIDYVRLNKITRNIHLQKLKWGRVILNQGCLMYIELSIKDQEVSKMLVWSTEKNLSVYKEFNDLWNGEAFELQTTIDGLEVLRFGKYFTLHNGIAFNKSYFPNSLERFFINLLNGIIYEKRWLSKITNESGNKMGWLLHEEVDFS